MLQNLACIGVQTPPPPTPSKNNPHKSVTSPVLKFFNPPVLKLFTTPPPFPLPLPLTGNKKHEDVKLIDKPLIQHNS